MTDLDVRLQRVIEQAKALKSRLRRVEFVAQDLIPYVSKEWTSHSGRLFGAGGGAVLRAMAIIGIPRKAKLVNRLGNVLPPKPGQLDEGDLFEIGGYLFRLKKKTRKEITLKIVGRDD